MILSVRQKKLLAIGRFKGFLSLDEVDRLYSSKEAGRNALRRLILGGFFVMDELGGVVRYVIERDSEAVVVLGQDSFEF